VDALRSAGWTLVAVCFSVVEASLLTSYRLRLQTIEGLSYSLYSSGVGLNIQIDIFLWHIEAFLLRAGNLTF